MLEIPEDHRIIELTREVNPKFVYPTETAGDISCKVQVTFSDKSLQLNPQQYGVLEGIALTYAKKNLEEPSPEAQ